MTGALLAKSPSCVAMSSDQADGPFPETLSAAQQIELAFLGCHDNGSPIIVDPIERVRFVGFERGAPESIPSAVERSVCADALVMRRRCARSANESIRDAERHPECAAVPADEPRLSGRLGEVRWLLSIRLGAYTYRDL